MIDWSDILVRLFQPRFRLSRSTNEFAGTGFNLSPEIGKISLLHEGSDQAMSALVELSQTVASA